MCVISIKKHSGIKYKINHRLMLEIDLHGEKNILNYAIGKNNTKLNTYRCFTRLRTKWD